MTWLPPPSGVLSHRSFLFLPFWPIGTNSHKNWLRYKYLNYIHAFQISLPPVISLFLFLFGCQLVRQNWLRHGCLSSQGCIRYSILKAKPTISIRTEDIEKDFSIPNAALWVAYTIFGTSFSLLISLLSSFLRQSEEVTIGIDWNIGRYLSPPFDCAKPKNWSQDLTDICVYEYLRTLFKSSFLPPSLFFPSSVVPRS